MAFGFRSGGEKGSQTYTLGNGKATTKVAAKQARRGGSAIVGTTRRTGNANGAAKGR